MLGTEALLDEASVGVLSTGKPVLLATTLAGVFKSIVVALKNTRVDDTLGDMTPIDADGATEGAPGMVVIIGLAAALGEGVRKMTEGDVVADTKGTKELLS